MAMPIHQQIFSRCHPELLILQANSGEWKRRTALKAAVLGTLKDSNSADACFKCLANVILGDEAIYK